MRLFRHTAKRGALPEQPDDDPMPQAPPPPDDDACCGQGCDPCILEHFAATEARYRAALRAWLERHPGRAGPERP